MSTIFKMAVLETIDWCFGGIMSTVVAACRGCQRYTQIKA